MGATPLWRPRARPMQPMQKTVLIALALLLAAPTAPPAAAACATATPPAEIGPEEARELYACIEEAMLEAYGKGEGVPGVPDYRGWTVVSSAPFRSTTHGRSFINHIANPVALPLYRRWEGMRGQRLPPGAIIAKESFEVTRSGEVQVGPLSLMEKAPPGTAPATDDWIYTRIYPDGRVQRTGGPGSRYLDFCHECHAATIGRYDAMFFPPEPFRATPG